MICVTIVTTSTSRYQATMPASGREQPRVRANSATDPIPTGAWRSVGNHPTAFARESLIDEFAATNGIDPLELRLRIMGDRARRVIELASEEAGWGNPQPAGWGRGIAYHATFNVTDAAQVAEVSADGGHIRVHRVVCAIDCGTVINPDTVRAQMEGGIVFGLTAASKTESLSMTEPSSSRTSATTDCCPSRRCPRLRCTSSRTPSRPPE